MRVTSHESGDGTSKTRGGAEKWTRTAEGALKHDLGSDTVLLSSGRGYL